jgi:hypothetical protein
MVMSATSFVNRVAMQVSESDGKKDPGMLVRPSWSFIASCTVFVVVPKRTAYDGEGADSVKKECP